MSDEARIKFLEGLLKEAIELLTMVYKARGGMMVGDFLKRATKALA